MTFNGRRSLTLTEWHLITKNMGIILTFSSRRLCCHSALFKSAHVIQGTCARMPLNVIFPGYRKRYLGERWGMFVSRQKKMRAEARI